MKEKNGGYTLVELLITLALTGLVFTMAGGAIYQINTTSEYGNERLTVQHEMQKAHLWLNRDIKEALKASSSGADLVLNMPDDSVVTYCLCEGALQRFSATTSVSLVRHVTGLGFSIDDRLVSVNIEAAGAEQLEESAQSNFKVFLSLAP